MLKLRKTLLYNYPYYILLVITIFITVIRLLIPKESNFYDNSNKVTGVVTKITITDKTTLYIKSKETVIATTNKILNNINIGDKVTIYGEFTKPTENTNKYLFNYQKYLYRKNIHYQVRINKILKIKSNSNIYYLIKNVIIKRLNNNPYLYTFILGDKTYLKKDVITSYQVNGISHLFAISGMHITLLSTLIDKLLKKIKLKEEKRYLIITIILLIYLLIVGLSPSILRGVLFYILFKLNNIKYFFINPINLFITVVSLSLLINPNYIYDVGYQYSYLISFSLLKLSSKLQEKNYFKSLLKVSIISFIVSLPITLYNFSQINILGIFYNLLFVPFVSIIIFPISLLSLIIPPITYILNLTTKLLETISLFLSKITIGIIIFKRLSLIIYFIYFILIIIYLIRQNKKILYILFILLIIHILLPCIDTNSNIIFLDVGQGDSIIINNKNKTIMIDTGGNKDIENNISQNIIIPSLKYRGIKKIDYLILTHGDFDHMGEAINLVESFKVEKVIFNCGEFNDLEKDLIKVLGKKKIKYYSCIKELNIDKNKFFFLQTKEYDNENDNSNVIYTELDDYKFIFMGDASVTTEKEILFKYNLPDIDVLKVGHHGSKTSSSKEFIDEIEPKYSIISVGKNNRYGHPNKEVLNVLDKSKIYRTDQDGSIMFKIKNNKLKIETCSP